MTLKSGTIFARGSRAELLMSFDGEHHLLNGTRSDEGEFSRLQHF